MLLLGLPSQDKLQKIWDDAEGAVPSYREVGATAASELPAGYHHDRRETNLAGVDVFEKAVIVLKNWSMHAQPDYVFFPKAKFWNLTPRFSSSSPSWTCHSRGTMPHRVHDQRS